MLSEALPIYSGGLGNVEETSSRPPATWCAGDWCGIALSARVFPSGPRCRRHPKGLYPYNDPTQLPITPVRDESGEWVRVEFPFPGYKMWVRVWQAEVGRMTLYLLDSNDPANPPFYRGITTELYGGGPELRLVQELVLGIGGWRLLGELGLRPEVCHLNEGHAALAVLERARSFMRDTGQPFDVALTAIRAGNLFTTHTPVAWF